MIAEIQISEEYYYEKSVDSWKVCHPNGETLTYEEKEADAQAIVALMNLARWAVEDL